MPHSVEIFHFCDNGETIEDDIYNCTRARKVNLCSKVSYYTLDDDNDDDESLFKHEGL